MKTISKSSCIAATCAALCILTPAIALASDDGETATLTSTESAGYGNHLGKLVLYGFSATGTNPAIPTTPAGTPASSKDYSAQGAMAEFHFAFNGDKTQFRTLLGFEGSIGLGYSAIAHADSSPLTDDETQQFIYRVEAAPTFGVIDFVPIGLRVTLFPGMGLSNDSPRFYGTYLYFSLAARVSFHIGNDFDVHAQYMYIPGTSTDTYYIREHRAELSANYGVLALGLRYTVHNVALSANQALSSNNPILGAYAGYAF